MGKTKKLLLLATTAIAAMALAAPGIASAANWVLPELEQSVETSYSGSLEFEKVGAIAGFACDVDASVTLQPGSGGSVDKFTLKSCEGTKGYSNCEGLEGSSSNLPWALLAESGPIDLNSLQATLSSEECPTLTSKFAFSHVKLTPDERGSISTLTVSGTEGTLNGQKVKVEVHGTLNATQPDTYGIGVGNRWILTAPKALTKAAAVEVSGHLGWEWTTWGTGIECSSVNGKATLLPGGEAEVGELSVNPASCNGFGASLSGCQAQQAYAGSEGTVAATGAGTVSFDELWIVMNQIKGCSNPAFTYAAAWGEVDAVPDNSGQISKLNIADPASIETVYGLGGGLIKGYLNVTPAGKYGIG